MKGLLSKKNILELFTLLNEELKSAGIQGELYVVGGAVMCIVFDARESTRDIDAYFKPSRVIRQAVSKISTKLDIADDWLNDSVKGYITKRGAFDHYLELSHLKILCAQAEYLLAMKCLAMRIGEEFHDIDDIRYLLRNLDIRSYQQACDLICEYYPLDRFPHKTLYALEELIEH